MPDGKNLVRFFHSSFQRLSHYESVEKGLDDEVMRAAEASIDGMDGETLLEQVVAPGIPTSLQVRGK